MSQANAPVLATVVAMELKPIVGDSCSSQSVATFAGMLSSALALTCNVQRFDQAGEQTAYTLVLPPESQTTNVLRRLMGVANEFGQVHGDVIVRFVVHSGVVFPGTGDKRTYVGSAIRSAHNMLRRLPVSVSQAATKEFVGYVGTLPSSPIRFSSLSGGTLDGTADGTKDGTTADDLSALSIAPESSPDKGKENTGAVAVTDADLAQFLSTRLAEDVGPFASVLVDSAQKLATTTNLMIGELLHEIENSEARERFEQDVHVYLKQRAENRDLQILYTKNKPKGKR